MAAAAAAPEGERNGKYRHGARTKEIIALKRLIKIARLVGRSPLRNRTRALAMVVAADEKPQSHPCP
jgi:hypothetical protein